jgi:hypothetical protein
VRKDRKGEKARKRGGWEAEMVDGCWELHRKP